MYFIFSFQEKLCHEIAGGLDDESVAQKVEEELEQVERQVFVLEKEENELRRVRRYYKRKTLFFVVYFGYCHFPVIITFKCLTFEDGAY